MGFSWSSNSVGVILILLAVIQATSVNGSLLDAIGAKPLNASLYSELHSKNCQDFVPLPAVNKEGVFVNEEAQTLSFYHGSYEAEDWIVNRTALTTSNSISDLWQTKREDMFKFNGCLLVESKTYGAAAMNRRFLRPPAHYDARRVWSVKNPQVLYINSKGSLCNLDWLRRPLHVACKPECSGRDFGQQESLPNHVFVEKLECTPQGQGELVRGYFRFSNVWNSDFRITLPETILIGEGEWDGPRGQLCMQVACRIQNGGGVLAKGDCGISISMQFPTASTVVDRYMVVGHVKNFIFKGPTGMDRGMGMGSSTSLPISQYKYTKFEQVGKTFTDSEMAASVRRYPDVSSFGDVGFDVAVENSAGNWRMHGGFDVAVENSAGNWRMHGGFDVAVENSGNCRMHGGFDVAVENSGNSRMHGHGYPFTIGNRYQRDLQLHATNGFNPGGGPLNVSFNLKFEMPSVPKSQEANASFEHLSPISSEGIYKPLTGSLCMVGCRSSTGSDNMVKYASLNPELHYSHLSPISAEGIYNPLTGSLCMVGCRSSGSDNHIDCQIHINPELHYSDHHDHDHISGSITGLRSQEDPHYFKSQVTDGSTLKFEMPFGPKSQEANASFEHLSRISAEGIYNPLTGSLGIVGYRSSGSGDNHIDRQIHINPELHYSDHHDHDHISGSITSLRSQVDPHYFKPMQLSSTTDQVQKGMWRNDLEITMGLVSLSLTAVVIYTQLLHITRHPNVLPFASLLTHTALTLGHLIPLLLNLEAFFMNYNAENALQFWDGWCIMLLSRFLLHYELIDLL